MLLFTAAALGSQPSRASLTPEENEWLAKHIDQIELWYNEALPPIEFTDENNGFSGITADIFSLVEERLGIRVPKKTPKDRTAYLAGLKNDGFAIAPAIVKLPERQDFLLFSSVYMKIPIVIIAPLTLGTGVTLDDLSGKKIAVVAGSATEEFVRQYSGAKLNVLAAQSVEEGLRMAAFGQADAYVGSLAVASHYITRQGITNLKLAGTTDLNYDLRIGVNKKYPLLFSSIQKALSAISQEEFAAVKNRWITFQMPSGLSSNTFRLLVIGGGVLCGAILILAAISTILKRRLDDKITRLNQARGDIAHSEARFRSFFENAPLPFGELDMDTGAIRFNRSFTDVFGYTNEEVPDLDAWWPRAYPEPEYRNEVKGEWERAVREKRPIGVSQEQKEYTISCKTGVVKQVDIRATLMRDRVLITFVDVSHIRHDESEIKKSLNLFQTLFDLLPFSCVINDMEGRYLLANQYFCETVQKPLESIVGRTMEELGRIVETADKERIISEIEKNGFVRDAEVAVRRNGVKNHILFSSCIIDWKDGKAILSSTVDISDRKTAETALKESEENLRVTLDSIGDAVIATDISGKVTRMNTVAAHLTGWNAQKAVGEPLENVFHIVNAETEERVDNPVQKVLSTGKTVDLANHTVLIARDGTRYQISDSGSPIRNDSGEIIGVVLVFRDVTGVYEMQERLRQSQKMEAIGVLAGGIAHDFNNILSALLGFADLAKLEAGDEEPMKRYLDSVSSAGLRARDLVRHILTFSRKAEVKKQPISIDPIIKETVKFIRASLPANIEIHQELKVHRARVLGDPIQFHQVLMNLFTNAGHAMKNKGGRLEIVLDAIRVNKADSRQFKDVAPGQYYQLVVSDTGIGIPKAVIHRIFEPFFTTKKREEGTGMGLSTVYGILKEMGGGISVYSEPGNGTTFKVLIPDEAAAEVSEKSEEPPLVRGEGRILVVDDEAPIVEGTRDLLSKMGYSVTAATSSEEALAHIRNAPRYFDLVLTDMTMPGMNGLDLSRSIKAINPGIPIVLCTGFSQGLTKEICTSAGIFDLVMKPMIASELSMTVHRALHAIVDGEEK
ncbi:MAG: PAS domain S-box protein [Desulfobacter sp.]|nr:MAG: PAS domain S-box protein [Desulfobacter sp.]